ncbi:response regulator [Notoacmeibacter marinus]|uniref:response regulator n=1 Tax=Notoacmeibacter marinus TaxID=1876515 RepID=UPI0013B069D6|nr:response regulator [Notoacmeibacter marinus]
MKSHELWLTERVLKYAAAYGYTTDSSTLEQPWRASICNFSDVMLAMLDAEQWPPELTCDADHKNDPLTAFSITEAKLHRQRGVSLHKYLGLTKYYRRAYQELISEHFPPGPDADHYRQFVDLFFDNSEVSLCEEWERQETSIALRQASETNRHLINEKNRYLTIFESLNEPVIIVDEAGRVTNLNFAAGLLFDSDAISGQGYYNGKENLRSNPQIAALIDHAGGAAELEYPLETRRGVRMFHVKVQRMLDVSEKFTGTVIILSDITDFHAAQHAAEAADRAKSAFLATMSHEIRTPITGILGIGELLQGTPLNKTQKSYVDALLSSGELLFDLVNDVLDYSKLEAGEPQLQPIVFSPSEMVHRIVRLSSGEAQRKGLLLSVEIADDFPSLVEMDGGKLQRILLNLINNAVKFTQNGSVHVVAGRKGCRLFFAVEDTGPGILEDDRMRIFEPFIQRPAAGAEQRVGTGLGLAICRRLAGALGAELTLDTSKSGGSVFCLYCKPAEVEGPLEELAPDPVPVGTLSVLLVEDNAINAMVIEGFLKSDGHRIDSVTSGEAALQRLGEQAYDLVLMDIRLEGADGFETIDHIRASADLSIDQVPILVLTADQTDEVSRRFDASGANAFQAKPFSRDDLRRAIQRALGASLGREADNGSGVISNVPVLERSVIDDHRKILGLERTRRIVDAFVETAEAHKRTLRDAASMGDETTMANTAHVLSSAAGMTGLRQLLHAASDAEERITTSGHALDLPEIAETLCWRIDQAIAALLVVKQDG